MDTVNGDSTSKMEFYEVIEQIGRDAFGAAFLVLHKIENRKYVMKKIRLSKQTEKFKRTAQQEMNLISKLHHPYIVEFKDAWVEKGSCICIVTNYCENGNISQIIRKARGSYFSEEKICKWLTQLLLAIDYLHSNRVLHRDLKLSSIFVTKENDIRLGDFGLAKLLDEESLASTDVGTPNYMCPELLVSIPYGYKSDIWSLGCCMFEIAAHHQAFRAPDMAGLINKIKKNLISPFPIVYTPDLKQIIKTMLRTSPEKRPTAAELLRHPHLQPYLLQCQNLSTVFLPVKSPSPNSAKDKIKKPSPKSTGAAKDVREKKERTLKHKELLPLFEESTKTQYPNLHDLDESLIEDKLVTKRVDPTSYSGIISNDSEDSKSGGTSCETFACDQENFDASSPKKNINAMDGVSGKALSEEKVGCIIDETAKFTDRTQATRALTEAEPMCSPQVSEREPEVNASDNCSENIVPSTIFSDSSSPVEENANPEADKVTIRSDVGAESRTVSYEENNVSGSHSIDNDKTHIGTDTVEIKTNVSNGQRLQSVNDEAARIMNNVSLKAALVSHATAASTLGLQRADALESLLELCARLLKEDKVDELCAVLKPFGEDAVSSRETAIWLTKSLMSAQKLAKESS